ncbi:twin transmembrane helix small protein [Solimonas sp. K1W22B-7]|uniref:twin transmembrane helix small protein n=1 Tax=Solimonas sp. K1W22B-7 TaxID=2303331 RepID=UPI000E331805|nr:twin transmembrane helix small protein [Solimonas sp. K1W22B-7]AXQ27684.1 twin transmembrane helix small protein [Solimonas sp. K1W22B-7]
MIVKTVVILLLLAIVGSLIAGGTFLVKDPSNGRRMLNSLKLRVALSVTLILFLVLSYAMGWIKPHGAFSVPAPTATEEPSR